MDLRCFQKIYKESRILFLRFRRKSTKPSKGLDFVANLETFFKFRSMCETFFKFRSTHETIFGLKRFRMEPFFFQCRSFTFFIILLLVCYCKRTDWLKTNVIFVISTKNWANYSRFLMFSITFTFQWKVDPYSNVLREHGNANRIKTWRSQNSFYLISIYTGTPA